MKKIIYVVVTAILLFSVGCTKMPDAEQPRSIYGSVVVNGEPVNAAAVLLTPGGALKLTGSDGVYIFSDLQPRRYELKIYAEGYQSFNKSIDVAAGKNEEVNIPLTKNTGNLSINKAYIDMGLNESNNVASFSILNNGNTELNWQITNGAAWVTKIEPQSGTVAANSAVSVVITIDRSKLSANSADNYATLVIRSTTAGDGSAAELLVTVFGSAAIGTNDFLILRADGMAVQKYDISSGADWNSAKTLCSNSRIGGYSDWRLPTIGELRALYNNKTTIGRFSTVTNSWYWSGTKTDDYSNYYEAINFNNSTMYDDDDDYYYYTSSNRVRCVRTLP